MLVLQIAAGIVLAYLIIRFRHSVWAVAIAIVSVGVIVAVVWGLGAGAGAIAENIPINWEKVLTLVVVLPCFVLAGVGAYGLLTIFHIAFKTERPKAEGDGCFPVLLLFAVLNMLILALLGVAFPTNPIARLAEGIDHWSRSSGHKDLGSTLFGSALMAVWPWLILLVLYGVARLRGPRPTGTEVDGSGHDGGVSE